MSVITHIWRALVWRALGPALALALCLPLSGNMLYASEATGSAAEERIRALHTELNIPEDYAQSSGLEMQLPPSLLRDVGKDMFDRQQRLAASAADAWLAMRQAAEQDGVSLLLVSAFRPASLQAELLHNKLAAGETIEQALTAVAAPGYSEHQSGRAIDVACAGCPVLETEFEDTPTFAWLQRNAASFGFYLSYPRDNSHGIMYEPWHWCYRADSP